MKDQSEIQGAVWPAHQTETLAHCPVCNSNSRDVLYSGLRDVVFGIAPGEWTLHRCHGCGCAYLDPRPDRDSIGLAYQGYYTHAGTGREPDQGLSFAQSWARRLANGYRNAYYGTREAPSHWLGIVVGRLIPTFRNRIHRSFRCLGPKDRGKRVLDVGFGGGNFLYWARAMGCRVSGTDPDPVAVANARTMGFDVRQGGIEAFDDERESFDIITLGHVIEHLHDPLTALTEAHALLKHGGLVWLETPNIDSPGRRAFGPFWRGLETPRHLILFDPASLSRMAQNAGFVGVVVRPAASNSILRNSTKLAKAHGYIPRDSIQPIRRSVAEDSEAFQLVAVKAAGSE